MKKGLIFATLFAAAAIVASAGTEQPSVRFAKGNSIFSYSPAPKSTPTLAVDARYNRQVSLRAAEAYSLFFTPEKTLVISDFPVGVQDYGTVQLRRTNQITDGNTLWMFNNQLRPGPKAVMYTGFIQNEEGSKVRVCMVNDRMYGIISHSDGTMTMIAPESNYDVKTGEHILASDKDPRYIELGKMFRCEADNVAFRVPDAEPKVFAMPQSTNLLEVEVGVEVDVVVFNKFLDDANNDYDKALEMTQAYMYSIFAMSSSLYEEEVNVMLTVTFVKVWSDNSESGYPKYNTFGSDGQGMLEKEAQVWGKINNKSGLYKRDLLHMCTAYTGTGIYTAGIAYSGAQYSGTVCLQDQGYGLSTLHYGITLPVLSFAWDVEVISHEMGHNFRSPHTHNCQGNVWPNNIPLDTCVLKTGSVATPDACYDTPVVNHIPKDKGTIMSYCHLLNSQEGTVLEFRPIVAAVIRVGAESAVSRGCVSEPANPIIKMQYPLGRNTISSGKYDTIRWTSAKVNTVRVEYSDNNGQSWTQIGADVSAGIRKMPWLVPAKGSNQYLIRVYDPTNVVVGDSSWVAFTVLASSLSLQYPAGGERIGQREKPTITWSSQLISAVKIELSPDGGGQWQTLAPSVTGNSYNWDVPNIETNQAIIRVSAIPNGDLVSQSKIFTIGKEKLLLTARENLDTLCKGKTWKFSWVYDFIPASTFVQIWVSDDGGAKWVKATGGLGAKIADLTYDGWTVPQTLKLTNDGRVRIVHRNDEAIADTLVTAILDCTFTSVNESWGDKEKPQFEVLPNPARDEVSVKLILKSGCDNAEFYLTDTRGQKVASLSMFGNMIAGEHTLQFDISTIAQGAYFLTLQSGTRKVSTPVRIVR